jgi:hypothetical protein
MSFYNSTTRCAQMQHMLRSTVHTETVVNPHLLSLRRVAQTGLLDATKGTQLNVTAAWLPWVV